MIIDGKAVARGIIERLKNRPRPEKALVAVLAGNNPQSRSFLRQKEKIAQELGVPFRLFEFQETVSEEGLISEIRNISNDDAIGGIIVQLPLPGKFDRDKAVAAIDPRKDVDALTPESRKLVDPLPVATVKEILKMLGMDIGSKTVAVAGKGFLVGKPVLEWLRGDPSVPVIALDSKSNLAEIKKADLVILGTGKGGLIMSQMLNPGAIVIDFGYGIKDGKMTGDFDPKEADARGISYTPVPGGTGPVLVAKIFENFYTLNVEN